MILRRTLSVAGARLSLAGADYRDKRAQEKKNYSQHKNQTQGRGAEERQTLCTCGLVLLPGVTPVPW